MDNCFLISISILPPGEHETCIGIILIKDTTVNFLCEFSVLVVGVNSQLITVQCCLRLKDLEIY